MKSRLDDQRAQCSGKVAFMCFDHAVRQTKRWRQRDRREAGGYKPYRCPHCRQWHLGRDGRRDSDIRP